MRNSLVRWWPGQRWTGPDGVHHAVVILDGGYFMDDEAEVACTTEREPSDRQVEPGFPTCVACWAIVLS